MWGCALRPSLASVPASSTMRAKPAVVKGSPRSLVNTKGEAGSCSRCRRRVKRGTLSTHPILGDELRALRSCNQWTAGHGIPLVHFSTDYVFDGSGSRPWREDDRPHPPSIYGASKLAGEEAIRAANGPHLIIRTEWVYAASGKNFLRTITRLASERKGLRIVADQCGAPTSAGLIADVVAQLLRPGPRTLAERFATAGGLLNVAASGETTWHGFAVAIIEGLKARGVKFAVECIVPIATDDYPTKAKRPANSRLDLTRLTQVFGIEPPRWEEALVLELDQVASEFGH